MTNTDLDCLPPRKPENEAQRLAALRSYGILDTDREEGYDALTRPDGPRQP